MAGVITNESACCGLGNQGQRVSWRQASFLSFVEVGVDPDVGKVLQQLSFGCVFQSVENAGAEHASGRHSSYSLHVAFVRQVYGWEFANGRNYQSDVASSVGKVASADNCQGEFVVEGEVAFEERKNVVLNGVDGRVCGCVGQSVEVDIERILSQHGDGEEVLEVVGDAPLEAALEVDLQSVVVGDHTRVELDESAALGHHGLGAVGDGLDQFQEAGLFGQEAGRVVVDVDVLEEEGLLGNEGAEKVLSQNARVLLFYHQQAINYYTLYQSICKPSASSQGGKSGVKVLWTLQVWTITGNFGNLGNLAFQTDIEFTRS